jgi:ABC-type transporter Mla subunit MlaD
MSDAKVRVVIEAATEAAEQAVDDVNQELNQTQAAGGRAASGANEAASATTGFFSPGKPSERRKARHGTGTTGGAGDYASPGGGGR